MTFFKTPFSNKITLENVRFFPINRRSFFLFSSHNLSNLSLSQWILPLIFGLFFYMKDMKVVIGFLGLIQLSQRSQRWGSAWCTISSVDEDGIRPLCLPLHQVFNLGHPSSHWMSLAVYWWRQYPLHLLHLFPSSFFPIGNVVRFIM